MSFTICCVALRMVGLAGMTLVFGLGWFITAVFINSRIPPETTEIYYIFGFNHICNNVDHMPAREVAAVLTPLATIPLVLFYTLNLYRMKYLAKIGKISGALNIFNLVTTPYNIFVFCLMHLWFVNPPDGEYGFVAHYIPYALIQWAGVFTAIQQLWYYIELDCVPFGLGKGFGKMFVAVFLGLTLYSQNLVVTVLVTQDYANGVPDPNGTFKEVLTYVYFAFCFVLPAIFSYGAIKGDGVMDKFTYEAIEG